MIKKEAAARLKINELLAESGWRLTDINGVRANIQVENHIKLEEAGDDFEHTPGGYVDYLLVDNNNRPVAVLEAKRESIHPLSAKEQARKYANSVKARYIILSNGDVHYLWDTLGGNPDQIAKLPTLRSLQERLDYRANPEKLSDERVDANYIARSQMPSLEQSPAWISGGNERSEFITSNKLKIMRKYQVRAIEAIQAAAKEGKTKYLLEMATGTGKTLTCAGNPWSDTTSYPIGTKGALLQQAADDAELASIK